jgi:hypothetical protein
VPVLGEKFKNHWWAATGKGSTSPNWFLKWCTWVMNEIEWNGTNGSKSRQIEPLKLPDLARPDRMPSLPAWVASRLELLSEVHQNDGTGKHRTMTTLPPDMMLGSSEKKAIAAYAGELGKMLEHTPEKTAAAEAETLVHVTKLMLALPGMRSSETGAEAAGEAYQAAWMICRRGRSPQQSGAGIAAMRCRSGKHPTITVGGRPRRSCGLWHLPRRAPSKGRVIELERLISAVPRVEYSHEHECTCSSGYRASSTWFSTDLTGGRSLNMGIFTRGECRR